MLIKSWLFGWVNRSIDNKQTIRLVEEEFSRLQTKVRHFDIHHYWLNQERQEEPIDVRYIPTEKMMANWLDKGTFLCRIPTIFEAIPPN